MNHIINKTSQTNLLKGKAVMKKEFVKQFYDLDVDYYIAHGNRIIIRYMKGSAWTEQYDFSELRRIVSKFSSPILPSNYFFSTFYSDDGKGDKGLLFSVEEIPNEIEQEDFDKALNHTDELIEKSHKLLVNGDDLVSVELIIPQEFKIPYKQYLLYFPQFMADQGVNLDVSLNDSENSTWVTVIPNSDILTEKEIKIALANYVQLTNVSDDNLPQRRNDVAYLQLMENIKYLNSQLSIITQGDANKSLPPPDTESFLFEELQVKVYDGKFMKIDLPQILRKLKRSFKK